MVRFCCAILLVLMVCGTAIAQDVAKAETYIARAGDVFVSEREFLERFELTPGLYRHRKPQLEGEKLYFLYSMIAEKLLAQEAITRNLDRDSAFQQAIVELTNLVSRDELYRQEVSQKVTVTETEVQEGITHALTQLRVRFLFFPSNDDAQFVRRQMGSHQDFDLLRTDSSMGIVRDTATVIWGDADTVIEAAAYKLRPGEISSVIQTGDGFYILKLDHRQVNESYASMQPDVLRERVALRIRARKEARRMVEFIREALKDKVSYSPSSMFARFADRVASVFASHVQEHPTTLTRTIAQELFVVCGGELNDTLIVAGKRVWTVKETIARLFLKSFSLTSYSIQHVQRRLHASFREWVEQELLAEEAILRGLDRLPEVQRNIQPWRDQYLASLMRAYSDDRVTVSDGEVYTYLQSKDSRIGIPQVQLRELHTNTLDDMREAVFEMERGISFEDIIGKWSGNPGERERKGLSNFFPITERSPLGEIASQLDIGQRYGPIRDSAGVVLFEVVAKKMAPENKDTSFSSRFEDAKRVLRRSKQKRQLTLFLAQIGKQRGFNLYLDRLQRLQVTPIPMMTFRMLGFGGRIFATPFVDTQLDWIEVEPPNGTIVP
jgi:parvulin-like peptidyl-prolyl isomerase